MGHCISLIGFGHRHCHSLGVGLFDDSAVGLTPYYSRLHGVSVSTLTETIWYCSITKTDFLNVLAKRTAQSIIQFAIFRAGKMNIKQKKAGE